MNTTKKALLWVGLLIAFGAAAVFFMPKTSSQSTDMKRMPIQIGRLPLTAFVADTPALQERGLSGSKGLLPGTGMLFVFSAPGTYSFWMKDMNFDIDMIWINSHMKVVSIDKSVSKNSYPKLYTPPAPILYVLEVPAGFSDKNKIKIGDSLGTNFD